MTVITRFAPSPTGYLHIGGARTALFNWLYAKHHGGKFYLRIEDTDRERSTQPAIDAIIAGLKWFGLDWEGDAVYQYARAARHADVAHEMIKHGKAFKCYTTQEELEKFRKENPNAKFRSPWRDRHDHPENAKYVVRIKAPIDGETVVADKVQGEVRVKNSELDDMVLLRSDGSPTYMLAVVVDDHDMGVTHIIRGDDHLTNSFRQRMIYDAMGWDVPEFAHIPLIHGADGAKLSKRHGALGIEEYEKMGYLPETLRNYLLRLGWSHGDDEIISTEQAIEWFDLDAVGKSPSRLDFAKLENLNGHYIREADDKKLVELVWNQLESGKWQVDGDRWTGGEFPLTTDLLPAEIAKPRILKGMNGLKQRAKNLTELSVNAAFYAAKRPITLDKKAKEIIDNGGRDILRNLIPLLEMSVDFTHSGQEAACRQYAESIGQKLGQIAQPLRAALSGKTVSPGVFEVMEILGKEESLGRLKDVC